MAMMMTGRVLLVCALCVLWCGAGGRCDGGETAGLRSDEPPPESQELEKSPQVTQDLQDEAGGVVETAVPSTTTRKDEEDGDDGDKGTEGEERTKGQGGQGGKAAPDPDSGERDLSGSGQQTHQSILSAGDISHSDSQESNANPTQTEVEGKNETDENTPAAENALTTVNGEHTLPAGIVEGNLPSPSKDSLASRKQDGEYTTSEGKENVPSPATAATLQSHRDKGSEGTGEDTKATTVTANTTDTTKPGDSDGSTAASHTTSPLLLLLFACAAAAAVVAA
ncbi:Mucin-associated surface protein (MASP) [Trypanosoma cruzi]|uniref:Mucin-associated surface protein (MASP), putative n=2 Tax=Trypanosoma cruzi TaxID=5693 RepID=Q4D099_TRYCC|nr:mucin-associated surface protein (MASP), putative [Trypanosoma cruzi]EAN85950.1 mucin-associated surface protein (MASP), putative [Trypanosoma cruzi]PWV09791.1 Mucin-associated surface protein (MASP) [Trypanosoma cruzi]|eukprot:XP_807801.1 mucin-associated surface protein (MASP) [Trypanosoma cruzi strain CL Brener]